LPEFERHPDPVDHASSIEEINLADSLAAFHRKVAQGQHPGPDYSVCVDCDDEIEPLRVQHHFARCLSCQIQYETRKKQFN
jgi:RNA polymerase-binding transcription factor DksA